MAAESPSKLHGRTGSFEPIRERVEEEKARKKGSLVTERPSIVPKDLPKFDPVTSAKVIKALNRQRSIPLDAYQGLEKLKSNKHPLVMRQNFKKIEEDIGEMSETIT